MHFVPLGGSEQFGVNFNLYTHAGRWLAVDCGIGFADHHYPGIDLLLPDPAFIEARKAALDGLIITHAHEDHIGAVPYLWPRLGCPIYCSPFTAAVLRRKFEEFPECKKAKITIVKAGDTVNIGPFAVSFIHVSHSIPDTCALLIETKVGRVLHSGDWNLDPQPVLGHPTDAAGFKKAGDGGILAYVGDSTNAEVPGRSGSEADVEKGLANLFRECPGRIAVTIFASNISRIRSIARAAKACNRRIGLVGRSLHTMVGAATDCGFMSGVDEFLAEDEISSLPDIKQLMIVTGSQGEARAALARIARGEHKNVKMGRGDTVVFSSRAIPGNETEINVVKNNLCASGVNIITPSDTKHCIHVSGHPCRDEIIDMLGWVRPQLVVPVHGERMMLEAQAELARACQVPLTIVPQNGSVVCLGPGEAQTIDHIETGLLAVEPSRIVDAAHPAIGERRKLQFGGAVHITIAMSGKGEVLKAPQVSALGLLDSEDEDDTLFARDLADEIADIIADLPAEERRRDDAVAEDVRVAVRRIVDDVLGFKPKVTVHVVRV